MSRNTAMALSALIAVYLGGCGIQRGTQQNLDNSIMISPGMTKQEVARTMGENPVKTEFNGPLEEWHYCRTGSSADEFIAVYFAEGRVIAMKPYTVTLRDVGGTTGTCEKFVKMGNFIEPDSVREYRIKFR